MDELTRILWEYASQCRLEGCYDLEMKRDRADGEKMAGINRALLAEAGSIPKAVENLWDSLELVRTVDREAAFACGLRLGLSLR